MHDAAAPPASAVSAGLTRHMTRMFPANVVGGQLWLRRVYSWLHSTQHALYRVVLAAGYAAAVAGRLPCGMLSPVQCFACVRGAVCHALQLFLVRVQVPTQHNTTQHNTRHTSWVLSSSTSFSKEGSAGVGASAGGDGATV